MKTELSFSNTNGVYEATYTSPGQHVVQYKLSKPSSITFKVNVPDEEPVVLKEYPCYTRTSNIIELYQLPGLIITVSCPVELEAVTFSAD